jgi:hypothetical protein
MSFAASPGYGARHDWADRHYDHHHHHWHGHMPWLGGPALIGLTILALIICWPVGVAALAFMIWSGKMRCGHYYQGDWAERFQEKMAAKRARWEERMAEHRARYHQPPSSGNRAFDEYRAETLRRLEDEEREFREFLDQLRFAKDKAEFDDFLRNRRPPAPPAPEAPSQG